MSSAPKTKYTDRDVRSNYDEFEDYAEQYLAAYEGEFEFLIDCKMRIASGVDLTVGMIRGVLNCMRVDPRWEFELPEPLPYEEAEVIPMPKKKRKPKFVPYHERLICPLFEAGLEHTHKIWRHGDPEFDKYQHCSGYYHINRAIYSLPARVKVPYLVARGGKMIHKVHESQKAYCQWWPNTHEYGFDEYLKPKLSVKVECKYPRWIIEPILLTEARAQDIKLDFIPLCKRCFSEDC